MKKELIPYEQALALKELGFDEPCIAVYEPQEIGVMLRWVEQQKVVSNKAIGYTIAPLYQQAFRWFREKYGLFHSITEYNKDGSLIIEISKDRVEIFRKMTNFDFTEYRESELECLKELIEIVKEE